MEQQTIVLVTCVAPKHKEAMPAKDLYLGVLFRQLMLYARSIGPDKIFILSGKHHLLHLDTIIEPYDLNLNTQSETYQQLWASVVLDQLRGEADLEKDRFVFLTNATYRKHLTPHINRFEVPMEIK
ncbi:MAG: hypothetical protein GY810_09780 [Aureispira sp.]|nr:hypothetical protein [Aureispira sp.]